MIAAPTLITIADAGAVFVITVAIISALFAFAGRGL